MGKDLVHFACHSCGHCCTDVVCLPTPRDVIRIVRHTKMDPRKFLEFIAPDEITGVSKSDPTWLKVGKKRYLMALRRGGKGCFFLKKKSKKCKIYEARPMLCRLYPFKLQESKEGVFKGFTLHQDVECPKNRDGLMATQPLYELYQKDSEAQGDYHDLVEVFNKRDYNGKKVEDFLDLFVQIKKKGG